MFSATSVFLCGLCGRPLSCTAVACTRPTKRVEGATRSEEGPQARPPARSHPGAMQRRCSEVRRALGARRGCSSLSTEKHWGRWPAESRPREPPKDCPNSPDPASACRKRMRKATTMAATSPSPTATKAHTPRCLNSRRKASANKYLAAVPIGAATTSAIKAMNSTRPPTSCALAGKEKETSMSNTPPEIHRRRE